MRYVVCGSAPDVMAWRVERGIPWRSVVLCSTTQGHLATRGLSGDVTVVRLPSWSRASERVRAGVDQNLAIVAYTGSVTEEPPDGRP